MRERLEEDWVAAVARLRDRRAILQTHDTKDESMTVKLLTQSKVDRAASVAKLKSTKRLLLNDSKKREGAMAELRVKVSREFNAMKMEVPSLPPPLAQRRPSSTALPHPCKRHASLIAGESCGRGNDRAQDDYEAKRLDIIAQVMGDLDAEGEKRLKQKAAITRMKGLSECVFSQPTPVRDCSVLYGSAHRE
jgi:hypothetical protein